MKVRRVPGMSDNTALCAERLEAACPLHITFIIRAKPKQIRNVAVRPISHLRHESKLRKRGSRERVKEGVKKTPTFKEGGAIYFSYLSIFLL